MSSKKQRQSGNKTGSKPRLAKSATKNSNGPTRSQPHPAIVLQRARLDPRSLTSANVLQLQRTLGNQAANKLLSGAKPRPVIQARLRVGPAHDPYEQEADRMAAQVMTAPALPGPIAQRALKEDALQAKPLAAAITPLVQRAMPEEEEVQTKALVQRAGGGFEVGAEFEARLGAVPGGGMALPKDTRDFMEQRMGADFSGVRVHNDGEANALSHSIQAQAFTHGQDIYFGAGHYQPESDSGKHLLAHELTHVAQQSGAGDVIHRKLESGKLNLVGEDHEGSKARRGEEKAMVQEEYGFSADQYWQENTFKYNASGVAKSGDSLVHLVLQSAAFLLEDFEFMKKRIRHTQEALDQAPDQFDATVDAAVDTLIEEMEDANKERKELELAADKLDKANEHPDVVDLVDEIANHIDITLSYYIEEIENDRTTTLPMLKKSVESIEEHLQALLKDYDVATAGTDQVSTQIVHERSLGMYIAAQEAAEKNNTTGVWKIGDTHAGDMDGVQNFDSQHLTVTPLNEFDAELKGWQEKRTKQIK